METGPAVPSGNSRRACANRASQPQQVPDGCRRVAKQHPRTRKPHHLPDFRTKGRGITMHRTLFTGGFFITEPTGVQPFMRIGQQLRTCIAKHRRAVLAATIQSDHQFDGSLLVFDPAHWAVTSRSAETANGGPENRKTADGILRKRGCTPCRRRYGFVRWCGFSRAGQCRNGERG